MNYRIIPYIVIPFILSACWTTTVIDEQQRAVPSSEPIQAASSQATSETDTMEASSSGTLTWSADKRQSFIVFTGKKGELASHEGKFNDYTISLVLDAQEPSDLSMAAIDLSVQIDSMETDSDGLTSHLLNEDFFAADLYPVATFVSKSITAENETNVIVTGDLTIKDVTREIQFPAVITADYLTMSFDLDRTEFGVGSADDGVDIIVPVEAKIVFDK